MVVIRRRRVSLVGIESTIRNTATESLIPAIVSSTDALSPLANSKSIEQARFGASLSGIPRRVAATANCTQ